MKNKRRIKESSKMCSLCNHPAKFIHHAYGGYNLDKSIKYGLGSYLCPKCYDNARRFKRVNETLRTEARYNFAYFYPDLDFYEIFKVKVPS